MDSNGSTTDSSKGLDYYWLALKRHWLPATGVFISVFLIALLGSFLKKPTYVAEGMLKFERSSPTSSLTGLGKEISNLEPLVEKSSPLATEAEVIRSNPVVQQVIEKLNLSNQPGAPLKVRDFLIKLKVGEIKGTDILKVSYTDGDPQKAATIVNELIAIYIETNILSHRTQAVAARQFIDKQLPKTEAEVSQAEEALRQFREANQIIALKEEASAAVSVLNDLQKQMIAIRSEVKDIDGEAAILRKRLGVDPRQAVALTALSQSVGVQELLKEQQKVETELAAERSRSQELHPRVMSLKEKVASLNRLLQERIATVLGDTSTLTSGNLQMGTLQQELTKELVSLEGKRQGLTSQFAFLAQEQANYQQRARSLPRLEKEQRELERRLEAAQVTYTQLLQKVGEIRVAENQNVGNARIIAAASAPDKPVSAKSATVLAALLLGVLAGGAVVYVLESRDKSIKTIEQAKKLLGFTLLGVIPHYQKARKAGPEDVEFDLLRLTPVPKDAPVSAISAAYRILDANLKFLSSDKPLKVIVISSSVSQEGKSTVSANLAAVMAQLGRRVVLVDADMYGPIQHRVWDLPNQVGLSNMLVEQIRPEIALENVMPNLDVLTVGVVPPNSIALLDSQRMAHLIENFSTHYDYVIIDAPPLSSATDALILSKLADGILLVVRPGRVDAGSASLAKGLLQQSGQNVLGMVINGVVAKNDPHSSYYFVDARYVSRELSSSEVPTVFTARGD